MNGSLMEHKELYPWLINDYKRLVSLTIANKIQSVIIHGHEGVGIDNLVDYWCKYLLCSSVGLSDGFACNICKSCVLFSYNNHPDYYKLQPMNQDKMITAESVRTMIDYLYLSTNYDKYKIIQIDNSDLLNDTSSNVLLKVLETPPNYAIFIIKSFNLKNILPTILSRCIKLNIKKPNTTIAYNHLKDRNVKNIQFWLDFSYNSPLCEIQIEDDTLQQFIDVLIKPNTDSIYSLLQLLNSQDVKYSFILNFINKWITDLVCYKLTQKLNFFNTYINSINTMINSLDIEKIFYLQSNLLLLVKFQYHPLNTKLQLENILYQYSNSIKHK